MLMPTRIPILGALAALVLAGALRAQLVADFSATPTSGPAPLLVSFTDLSTTSAPGGITSWAWDFETDSIIDSTMQNPVFVYGSAGVYTVTLTVTDAVHAPDHETKPQKILVGDPLPKFTVNPESACEGEFIGFDETTSGTANTFEWTYANGSMQTITSTLGGDHEWAYATAGEYQPSLRVKLQPPPSNLSAPYTLPGYLTIYPCGSNPKGPGLFRIHFDEPRGNRLANTCANASMPTEVTLPSSTWQLDPGPGREYWKTSEDGFGALGVAPMAGDHCITTGWAMNVPGSMTVAWWQRSTGHSTMQADAWGGTGASSPRCFTGGAAGDTLVYSVAALGDFSALVDVRTSAQWTHVALVIDDQRGFARWYIDGVQTNVMGFLPGAHLAMNTGFHIAWHTDPMTAYSAFFALDDFVMDLRAYSAAEIAVLMMGEQASHSTFDAGCPGSVGVPVIGGSTSPILGSTFVVTLSQMPANSLCALFFGLFTDTSPIPLDLGFLGATGCLLSVSPDLSFLSFSGPSGSTSFAFSIPNAPLLLHSHFYFQGFVRDPPANAGGFVMTAALDVLINDC
jgi:hypothetical protein